MAGLYARLGWRAFAGRLVVRQRKAACDFTLDPAMTLAVGSAPADGTIVL